MITFGACLYKQFFDNFATFIFKSLDLFCTSISNGIRDYATALKIIAYRYK